MATAVFPQSKHPDKMSGLRKLAAVVLAVIMLAIAGALYAMNRDSGAPTRSTTESRPNSSQNVPPGGSVTQDGNPADPMTPNPNGTGNNTILAQ